MIGERGLGNDILNPLCSNICRVKKRAITHGDFELGKGAIKFLITYDCK